jgi:hypothetical protein
LKLVVELEELRANAVPLRLVSPYVEILGWDPGSSIIEKSF